MPDSVAPRLGDAIAVWRRNARVFSHIWKGALLPLFLDPLFYLVSLGFGLGTYLASVNGIPYKDFIAPGLCASAVMWAATFETTWNTFFKMAQSRQFDAIVATPVEPEDLVLGELLWAATRAFVYGTVFLVVVVALGLTSSPWVVALPPFLFLGGACFAACGLANTSVIPKQDYFTFYYTLFVTPMVVFGGIFYPYDRLPDWAQAAAWFTPLYHLVNISRDLATGPDALAVVVNAAWLLVVTVALFFAVPARAMRRRLVA
jgi:lipooligosaccharide transport system permease protein